MSDDKAGSLPDSGDRSDPPEGEGSSPSLLARLFGRREETPPPPSRPRPDATNAIERNIITLRETRVEDIAVRRADIVAVPDDITLDALIALFRETALTRVPVYHGTLDDPLGFIHLKDLVLRHGFPPAAETFDLKGLLREMVYIPASMRALALLQKMQRDRAHMALVIDEYGGVDGLITFEDLVEEIVGEIEDEHDTDDPAPWRLEAPDTWVVRARTELGAFEAEAGIDLRPGDLGEEVDTLGGLVFMLSGRVPERGEVVTHPDGHRFEVLEADARHIERLRIRLIRHRDAAE